MRRSPPVLSFLGVPTRPPLRAGLTVALAFLFAAGLLALAGWFIAASAVAGLATVTTFSFLYPSAGVQALALLRTLARYVERVQTHEVTLARVGDLRTVSFARATALPRGDAAALRSSELLGRIVADTDAVDNILLRTRFPQLTALVATLATVGAEALISLPAAAAAGAGLLAGSLAMIAVARPAVGAPASEVIDARGRARREIIETVDGLSELRSFGLEDRARDEISRHLEAAGASRCRLSLVTAFGQSVGGVVGDLALLVVAVCAAGLVGGSHLSAPVFVTACLIMLAAYEPIAALPSTVVAAARSRAAGERLADLLRGHGFDRPGPRAATPRTWSVQAGPQHGGWTAEAGSTVVITGRSGSGKSTLLRAIAGDSERPLDVLISGTQPSQIDGRDLVEHVCLVAQDAQLFNGTIYDNLVLAAPRAATAQLNAVLTATALDETTSGLTHGLATLTGPAGSALSGGQRRRLSIAQGLLRQPDVLLLDEPTEGLDPITARRVLSGARELLPGAIVIVALHDRHANDLPWIPDHRIDLTPVERPG